MHVVATYRILANSLLMRFSSSSRALAFLKSAMNWTRPRMLELLLLERPRKPPPEEDILSGVAEGCRHTPGRRIQRSNTRAGDTVPRLAAQRDAVVEQSTKISFASVRQTTLSREGSIPSVSGNHVGERLVRNRAGHDVESGREPTRVSQDQ